MKNEERFTGFKLRFRPKVQFAPETAQIGFPPCPLRRPPAVRGNAPMDAACPVRGSHARAVPLLSAACPRLPAVASLLLHARQSCAMLSPHSPCRFLPRAAARAQRRGRHCRAAKLELPLLPALLLPLSLSMPSYAVVAVHRHCRVASPLQLPTARGRVCRGRLAELAAACCSSRAASGRAGQTSGCAWTPWFSPANSTPTTYLLRSQQQAPAILCSVFPTRDLAQQFD